MHGLLAAAITVGRGGLSLRLDPGTGDTLSLSYREREIIKARPGESSLDVLVDRRWLRKRWAPKLLDWRWDEGNGVLTIRRRIGDWEAEEIFKFWPGKPRIERLLRLRFVGEGERKIRLTSMRWPGVDISWPEGICWCPRGPGLKAKSPELQKLGSGYAILQVGPKLSLLFTNEPRKEPTWVAVEKVGEGRATVEQAFKTLGFVYPGEVHEIGPCYLTIVEGDAERALRGIWEWFDAVGIRVPKDRPDWVYNSVLYSFHPGGTIGSNCLDLGGFEAARRQLLPLLNKLGIMHIWMLPLEEPSIYCPRDYFKFQEGLGSPEEFGRLVNEAHSLGMRVFIDIVPHGGTPEHGRYRGNPPDMLVYTEDGKTLNYWCFDFRHKGWQEYIRKVAEFYVKTYGIDGYRIDAVAGSRIPNWNHKGKFVPMSSRYSRASLSVREGGLQMIRTIREAVRKWNPEGAVLAEVEGAPYAAEADIVYDFTTCHRFTFIRQMSPAEFAEYLRDWLHEQKFTDPRGTLRLRYTESHDTVRSQGLYGVSLMRAFWAICCWLDGVPMLYHEQEIGHEAFLRRVIAIRHLLPELRRGESFFDAVRSETPGVFAFLRSDGKRTSVVVANLNPQPVEAVLSIPSERISPKGARRWFVWNGMRDEWLPKGSGGFSPAQLQRLKVRLEAHEATVLALRPRRGRRNFPPERGWGPARPRGRALSVAERGSEVIVKASAYSLLIDKRTGLLTKLLDADGRTLVRGSDLALSPSAAVGIESASVKWRRERRRAVVESEIKLRPPKGKRRSLTVKLTLECSPKHVLVKGRLEGARDVERAMLVLSLGDFGRWQVKSTEGLLDGWFVVRHTSGRRGTHGIYWRPQGTNVFWQSEMTPLDVLEGFVRLWREGGEGVEFRFLNLLRGGLDNVMLLDKFAGKFGPHLALAWVDKGPASLPGGGAREFLVAILPLPDIEARSEISLPEGVRLRHTSSDWVVETDFYRVVLRRSGGAIREVWALKPSPRKVLDWCDLYSDRGFFPKGHSKERAYLGASWDGEAGVKVWAEGDVLRMRFYGRLRGLGRFDLPRPGVWFYVDYAFPNAPCFRLTYGVRADGGIVNPDSFLALAMICEEARGFEFRKGGRVLKRGTAPTGARRFGETKGREQPDEVALFDREGREILRLRRISLTWPLCNVFLHRPRLFLCWLDGPGTEIPARWWCEASLLLSLGAGGVALPRPPWVEGGKGRGEVLDNPSFEEGEFLALLSGRLVGFGIPSVKGLGWLVPKHGSITHETAHTGAACAKVEHKGAPTNCWCLFTQALPLTLFPPGSEVRFGAWVKGRGIERGEVSWKRGTVRLAIKRASGKTEFVEVDGADSLVGTFGWRRVEGRARIPEDAVSLQFQAGLNGAPDGTMWIDDCFVKVLTKPSG